MASRNAANFSSVFYQESHAGQAMNGDIGWEKFSEKTEVSKNYENFDQLLNIDRKLSLLDLTPDKNALFPEEETQHNIMSCNHLNLRDDSIFGSTIDPYANPDYDSSFHDHDPRNYNDQQPQEDYCRSLDSRIRMLDFKDDGDYSVTGSSIHPQTIYKNIRNAQDWIKARLKIFDTFFEGRSNGGVRTYSNISNVFKSECEPISISDDVLSAISEDPLNRQCMTMFLNNIVHGGSMMLRSNETTNHKVAVASYGKLYANRGLILHKAQMRMIQDDTPWQHNKSNTTTPKRLIILMTTTLEDESNMLFVAVNAHRIYQDAVLINVHTEKFQRIRSAELTATNNNYLLTCNIMSLLGFTQNEIKFLESKVNKNPKFVNLALVNLYKMGAIVHVLLVHAKLELCNELLIKFSGLMPGTANENRKKNLVDIKICNVMDSVVKKMAKPSEPKNNSDIDPEHILEKRQLESLISKPATPEDSIDNRQQSLTEINVKPTKNNIFYKFLKRRNPPNSKRITNVAQFLNDAELALVRKTPNITDQMMCESLIDSNFGKNKALIRHIGKMGTKNMTCYMNSDYYALDFANEIMTR